MKRVKKDKITPTIYYRKGGYRIPFDVYGCFIVQTRGCRYLEKLAENREKLQICVRNAGVIPF